MIAIEGKEKLVSLFGRWPSFHDAEVWSLTFERTERGVSISATIHTFEMTSEVDARGYFQLVKHTRVVLRFEDCEEVDFSGFNQQNALSGLAISGDGNGVRPRIVIFFLGCLILDSIGQAKLTAGDIRLSGVSAGCKPNAGSFG